MKPSDLCLWCEEPVRPDEEAGDPMPVVTEDGAVLRLLHHECRVRMIAGGANHQLRRCTCFGGSDPNDPPGLTTREAARVAAHLYFNRHRTGAVYP